MSQQVHNHSWLRRIGIGLELETMWCKPVLVIAMIAIGYIYLAGWLGANVLTQVRGWGPGIPESLDQPPNNLTSLFFRWDASYYFETASQGYDPVGNERAFFPLYPIIVRVLSGTLHLPLLWSGLIVSLVFFLGTNLVLYRWVRIDLGAERALLAVTALSFFPVAYFQVSFYAESLFIFLSILSLYFASQGKFLLSGLAIAFAGATRPQAFLLGVPYLIEFWQQRNLGNAKGKQFIGGLCFAPLGLSLYTVYLAFQQPGFSLTPYFDLLEQEWQTYMAFPWVTLWDGINAALFGVNINPDWFSRVYVTQDLFYAMASVPLGIYAIRHLRPSIAIYLIVSIIYFYTIHGPYGYAFDSMPRHVASLVPIYPALAHWALTLTERWRWLLLASSAAMLGILAAWFASGRWVS